MPVRRISVGGFAGYGSFGQNVISVADKTFLNFKLEARNIVSTFPPDTQPSNPIQYVVMQVYWRWKFTAGLSNADLIKLYNARIDKRRLGVVVVEHRSYNYAEEFVCFPTQMSRIYATSFVCTYGGAGSGDVVDDLPCDEPPSDVDLGIINPGNFYGSSWSPQRGSIVNFPGNADIALGDILNFYPERGLLRYNFGGGYVYNLIPVRKLEVDAVGVPVVINL